MSSAPRPVDLSIVIVSWRVPELLVRCLESIAASTERSGANGHAFSHRVVVVDNASNDGTVERLRQSFPEVVLITNNENRGFAAACNQGARAANSSVLCFLNPDTEVLGEALWELLHVLPEQSDIGIVGPQLKNPDGTIQPSCRSFPGFTDQLMVLLKLHHLFPNSRSIRRYYQVGFRHETVQRVDQIMGACLVLRRTLFDELGGFDEGFFLWFEEVDFCRRAAERGAQTLFYPDAKVQHQRSSGFAQRRPLWRQWYFSESCRRYFWKHHSLPAAAAIAVGSYLALLPAAAVEVLTVMGLRLKRRRDV